MSEPFPRESRPYVKMRQGTSTMGRTEEFVTCPFCKVEVKTYLWSRCGSGKVCPCGALLCGNVAIRRKSEHP